MHTLSATPKDETVNCFRLKRIRSRLLSVACSAWPSHALWRSHNAYVILALILFVHVLPPPHGHSRPCARHHPSCSYAVRVRVRLVRLSVRVMAMATVRYGHAVE